MDLWRITWFTVVCAAGATVLILPPGVVLAWLLARRKFPGRVLVETFVSLPLVMPPVATGLILLMLLSRRGSVGRVLERLGIEIVFTWKAVVLAMAIMGLPLLVRTARAGFEQVNARYEQRRGDARRVAGARLPDDQPAARVAVGAGRRRARVRARARRVRRDDHRRRQHPGRDADAGGRRSTATRRRGRTRMAFALLLVSVGDRVRRALDGEPARRAERGVIDLDIELAQGSFVLVGEGPSSRRAPPRSSVRPAPARRRSSTRSPACARRGAARSSSTAACSSRRTPASTCRRTSATSATCRRTWRSFRT